MTLPFAAIPLSIIIKEFLAFPSQLLASRKGRAPGRREKERDVHPDEVASKFYYYIRVLGLLLLPGRHRTVGKSYGAKAWRAPSGALGASWVGVQSMSVQKNELCLNTIPCSAQPVLKVMLC